MPMLVPIVLHDQKSHDISSVDDLDVKNTMVPLIMLSTSHDAGNNAVEYDTNTNTDGYHMTKKSCSLSFQFS